MLFSKTSINLIVFTGGGGGGGPCLFMNDSVSWLLRTTTHKTIRLLWPSLVKKMMRFSTAIILLFFSPYNNGLDRVCFPLCNEEFGRSTSLSSLFMQQSNCAQYSRITPIFCWKDLIMFSPYNSANKLKSYSCFFFLISCSNK